MPARGGLIQPAAFVGGTAERYGLLALLMVTWGSAPAIASVALRTLPPVVLAAGRLWLAALILLAVLALRGARLPSGARAWRFFALLGLVGNALPFWLIMHGQLDVPSGLTSVCFAAMPIATLLLAAALFADEPLTLRRAVGFTVAFCGILVLLWPSLKGLDAAPPPLPFAAILAGVLCYAISTVLARKRPPMGPLAASAGTLLLAALLITPAAAWRAADGLGPDAAALVATAALAVWCTVVPTLAFFRLITLAGAGFASQMSYLIPVWGFFLGVTVMGEAFRSGALAALALLVVGMVLSGREPPPPTGQVQRA